MLLTDRTCAICSIPLDDIEEEEVEKSIRAGNEELGIEHAPGLHYSPICDSCNDRFLAWWHSRSDEEREAMNQKAIAQGRRKVH